MATNQQHEITFKDLQMDERYKKLERTLKMVLLKNADRRSTDSRSSIDPAWPSLSSINGDNFDTSCAAMSIQSSRIGSEVVSSSRNLKNILLRKNQYDEPCNNIATSSEKQFPTNNDDIDDCAMMPPPRSAAVFSTKSKRFGSAMQASPLPDARMNLGRKESGFSMSTPANSVIFNPKHVEPVRVNSGAGFQESNNNGRNEYERICDSGQHRERIFSRWRVLLNDKGQLIIKGTLECGKVARSKPVIRRLAPTSVQSIYKHTYRLQGNLVDERSELPDYVRGKFFNGFPDDWENVYQIWRNFVSDGSIVSFRWPTAVTDSDDDIKSGITEMSYYPEIGKSNKNSGSPRKRKKCVKSSSMHGSFGVDKENRSDFSQCNCSKIQNVTGETAHEIFPKDSDNSPRNKSKINSDQDSSKGNAILEGTRKSEESSSENLNTPSKIGVNSLKDIIQEDKLNIIIDNLTNKNCSIEYVNKIVEMFGCLKYIVSYRSTEENDSEKCKERSNSSNEKETSRSPKKKDRSTDEKSENENTSNSVNRTDNRHNYMIKNAQDENLSDVDNNPSPRKIEKSYKDQYVRQTRRKLTKHDYDSSESESDFYDDSRKKLNRRFSTSHGANDRLRKSQKYKINDKQYRDSENKLNGDNRTKKYAEISDGRNNRANDSSLSEDEPAMQIRSEEKLIYKNRGYPSPGKFRTVDVDRRRRIDNYDSSISITEDEGNADRCNKHSKVKDPRKVSYDSSVSITEDEHGDIQNDRRRLENLKYYTESNSHSADDPNVSRISISTVQRPSRNIPPFVRPIVNDDIRQSTNSLNPTLKNHGNNGRSGMKNLVSDQQEDSAYMSSEMKRSEKSKTNREPVEIGTSEFCARSNESDFVGNSENAEVPPATIKVSQGRKKPVVVSSELAEINLKSYNWLRINQEKENEMDDEISSNTPRNRVDRTKYSSQFNEVTDKSSKQKSSVETTMPETTKISEPTISKIINKEPNVAHTAQERENLLTRETKCENVEKSANASDTPPQIAKYGTETNPKLLTTWVPAVLCDDAGNSKCNLIFEGKLLNEAGHVVNRKFTTDFVKRRLSPKLIETVSHVFYQLVGDLNDTKHVVPKELLKLCHVGCPGKIGQFCERWKSLSADNTKIQLREATHNTSVDCLSVSTSSRGRRILPPLCYWTGERVTMKDNKAIYSPGNSQESSIPSSLDKTNEEARDNKNDIHEKRSDEPNTINSKKKIIQHVGKISSPMKVSIKSPPKSENSNKVQRLRNGKRRLSRNVQASSSESNEDEEKMSPPVSRKQKARTKSTTRNTENGSRKLRNSSKNSESVQNLENSKVSPRRGQVENIAASETKSKLRKRQKVDYGEESPVNSGTLKSHVTRRPTEVTCTYYKNVPLRDDDLSEDQLSTI